MSEIVIKVQLDLSDAVKEFMASLMGGCGAPLPVTSKDAATPKPAEQEPEPTPETAAPVTPTPVVAKTDGVSREKIRELVKAARIAEKSLPEYDGGVKQILAKYGASNVPEIKEEHFVDIAAELTRYKENLPPF